MVGRISRVDPATGEITTVASGLPPWVIGVGGSMDIAFIGQTAYVVVTMVATDLNDFLGFPVVPGDGIIVGIYRIDGPDSYTVIADLGAHALANPPTIEFEILIPSGVQYTLETFRGGLLVSGGHLNRVLWVSSWRSMPMAR